MAKKTATPRNEASLGKELNARLRKFTETLESSDNFAGGFTRRTVRLQMRLGKHDAASVKRIRDSLRASQPIFAQFLGVSVKTVQDWERDAKPPSGAACRLLDEISGDPAYWRTRLAECATPTIVDTDV
jgi:putative transcriptional regulator